MKLLEILDRGKEGEPIIKRIKGDHLKAQAQPLSLRWDIPDKPSPRPHVGVIPLIPVDAVITVRVPDIQSNV
jgi:hypothetical protein